MGKYGFWFFYCQDKLQILLKRQKFKNPGLSFSKELKKGKCDSEYKNLTKANSQNLNLNFIAIN